MKSRLAGFRDAVSFIAGILIGASIMVLVSAGMTVDLTGWQVLLLFGAPVILAAGVTMQAVVTAKARHRRVTSMERGWHAVR
jgi:hypothetical protein